MRPWAVQCVGLIGVYCVCRGSIWRDIWTYKQQLFGPVLVWVVWFCGEPVNTDLQRQLQCWILLSGGLNDLDGGDLQPWSVRGVWFVELQSVCCWFVRQHERLDEQFVQWELQRGVLLPAGLDQRYTSHLQSRTVQCERVSGLQPVCCWVVRQHQWFDEF